MNRQEPVINPDFAFMAVFVRIDHRLDRLDERVARIERRLDLVEA